MLWQVDVGVARDRLDAVAVYVAALDRARKGDVKSLSRFRAVVTA